MIGKKIKDEKPIPLAVAKSILSKREKEGELHYEQKLALEHVKKFAKTSEKDASDLVEKLMKLDVPRFKERHAVKIVDLMPEDAEALKLIFSKETISLKKEQMDAIIDILKKAR